MNGVDLLTLKSPCPTCSTCLKFKPIIDAETNETISDSGQCSIMYFIEKANVLSCINHSDDEVNDANK